jgi:hypothetical protein
MEKKKNRRHEKGAVLSIAILVGVVLLVMAVPFFFRLSGQYRSTDRSAKALSAFNLAEAGIDRGLYEISHFFYLPWTIHEDGSLNATLAGFQTADGKVVGDVDIGFSPLVSDRRVLTSTGRIPYLSSEEVTRTVLVNLERHLRSIFDFGIFADDYIYAKTNWGLDSYNSDDGPYDAQDPGDEGHAGTNGTDDDSIEIAQGQSSEITGNLVAGFGSEPADILDIINLPDEDPDWLGGDRLILGAEYVMPPVNVLELPPQPGSGDPGEEPMFEVPAELDLSIWFNTDQYDGIQALKLAWVNAGYLNDAYDTGDDGGGTIIFTPDRSGVYTDFVVGKQDNLVIQGNVVLFVTGGLSETAEFLLDVGSTLQIAQDSSLTLILGNTTFDMINNTVLNETQVPSNLLILGTGQFVPVSPDTYNMYWNNNVDTYAAIYVPGARVKYEANTDLYGALVSMSIDIKNNVNFHYDEALKKIEWLKGGIPYYVITSWQERIY